ncbi:hypothetical protein K9O30_12710 [Clostridium bowmanii]|uniref:hypothetical protein n=1 Tax=Clostridium bowmanii TaxID=132925 RepID=UPI001C0C5E8E|nr:hypothetical protein [Clostridium bowmanii]MBU3189997.1 hypothetical protein [Clostridium bowmanii]MCA1074568.1 hypothetical protein [Clostridium bowmanii]
MDGSEYNERWSVFLLIILLFSVIYFAVRLAIIPLINEPDEERIYQQDFGLVKLRDIDILSPTELDEVIEIYQKIGTEDEDYEQYHKSEKVLNELKEIGYFTDEEFSNRIEKFKKYFKVK